MRKARETFERLRSLGEEKFQKIVNAMMRGEKAITVARMIQSPPPDGWGDLHGIAERAVMQQLFRLRTAIAEGTFGRHLAKQIAEGRTPHLSMLERISPRVLDRMEELSEWQRERVIALKEKEAESLLPQVGPKMAPQEYRHLLTQTNMVFSEYRQTLLDLQDIRFKLGMDEFKGPVGSVRGAVQTTTFPDGMSVQKQVFEAITTVEKIFEQRKIQPFMGGHPSSGNNGKH